MSPCSAFDPQTAVGELLVEPGGADLRAAEDDRLLGLLGLEHLDQAVGLLARLDLDVGLLDRVDGELLRGHLDRHRLVHVLLGQARDRRRHRRREEAGLAARRAHAEDPLDVLDEAEVEHLVGLVEDHVAGRGEDQRAARDQVHHPPDGGDDDVGAPAQPRLLGRDRRAAEDRDDLDVEVLGVGAQRLGHLDAELAGRGQDDRLRLAAEPGRGTGAAAARRRRSCRCPVCAWPITSWPAEQLGDRLLLDRASARCSRARRARQDLVARGRARRKVWSCDGVQQQLALVRRPAGPRARARRLGERVDAADDDLELARGDGAEQVGDPPPTSSRRGSRCMSQKPITGASVAAGAAYGPRSALATRFRRRPSARTAPGARGSRRTPRRPHISQDDVDLLAAVGLEDRRRRGPRRASRRSRRRRAARPARACPRSRRARSPARRRAWRAAPRASRCPRRRLRRRPSRRAGARRSDGQRVGGQSLQQERRRLIVADLVGHRDQQPLGHATFSRVAAVGQHRGNPAAVGGAGPRSRRLGSAAGSARRGSRCGWRACRRS